MRTIGVVTVSRSDYGIYLPVLRRINQDPELGLHLIVAGAHLAPEHGLTARAIEKDGFYINRRVEMLLSSDTPQGIAKSMGLGTIGFAEAYADFSPDILLVLGDRFEMHAAALASVPFNIPMAHIHGGESTEGAIDEALRHSITKMSHLHFTATEEYARRLIQMGEEPWRVTVSGAPSLDNLGEMQLLSWEELAAQYRLDLSKPALLVTYHPVTLEYKNTETQVDEMLAALEDTDLNVVFTYPNTDTCNHLIIDKIRAFVAKHQGSGVAVNLGTRAYFSLMDQVAAMVGNSSSGIIEAASFKLPVVNIGRRQLGRVCGLNVIDVGHSRSEIYQGIQKAIDPSFRLSLADLKNPYGEGRAADKIVEVLKQVKLDGTLLMKHFHDIKNNA